MDIRRRLRWVVGVYSRGQRGASPTDADACRRPADSGQSVDDGSASGWLATESRSQSEVLGTVLILGLSMTAIGIALAGGGVALGDLISDAEASNVENGMSHLSSKASLVALGDADSQRFSLGSTQEGTVTVRPEAGSMNITHVTNESRNETFQTDLGAIVYEGKNREIGYQSGGIWIKRGDNSTMSSPPEYYYRGTTLTLPIIQVSGEGAVGGRTQGQITPVDVGQDAVEDVPTPLEEGIIEIKIQSEYYQGWYTFLSERTSGEIEVYHNNNTVVSKLTVPDEVTFTNAMAVQSGPEINDRHQNSEISDDSIEYNFPTRSAAPLIADKVEDASGTNNNENTDCISDDDQFDSSEFTDECTITNSGTYFIDGDSSLEGNLNIDTNDGNVSLVIDGNFDIESHNITVTDTTTGNGVTYYINGSLRSGSNNAYVGTDNPEAESDRNVFFVADQFLDSNKGRMPNFEAIIYAPDADLVSNGNGGITGAVVLNSFDIGPNIKLEYDDSLSDKVIDLTGTADPITYLHVSHNEIRVELN